MRADLALLSKDQVQCLLNLRLEISLAAGVHEEKVAEEMLAKKSAISLYEAEGTCLFRLCARGARRLPDRRWAVPLTNRFQLLLEADPDNDEDTADLVKREEKQRIRRQRRHEKPRRQRRLATRCSAARGDSANSDHLAKSTAVQLAHKPNTGGVDSPTKLQLTESEHTGESNMPVPHQHDAWQNRTDGDTERHLERRRLQYEQHDVQDEQWLQSDDHTSASVSTESMVDWRQRKQEGVASGLQLRQRPAVPRDVGEDLGTTVHSCRSTTEVQQSVRALPGTVMEQHAWQTELDEERRKSDLAMLEDEWNYLNAQLATELEFEAVLDKAIVAKLRWDLQQLEPKILALRR